MCRLFLIFLACVGLGLGPQATAQNLDSLRAVLGLPHGSNSARAVAAGRLAQLTWPTDTAQAWRYARLSLHHAHASRRRPLVAEAYKVTGDLHNYAGRRHQALRYFTKSRAIYLRCLRSGVDRETLRGLVAVENNIAALLYWQNNAYGAINMNIEAAKHSGMTADSFHLDKIYNNIGAMFLEIDQKQKALQYMLASLKIKRATQKPTDLFTGYTNVATTYLDINDVENCEAYLRKAAVLLAQNDNLQNVAYYYTCRSNVLVAKGRYAAAEQSLHSALRYIKRDNVNVKPHSAYVYRLLTDLHLKQQHFKAAQATLDSSWALNEQAPDPEHYANLVFRRAQLEEHNHQYAAAAKHYREYSALADSLVQQQSRRQINAVENKYQTAQRDQQITQLQRQRRAQAAELRQQRQLNYAYLSLLVAAAGLGALGLVAVRSRQRLARQRLALQRQQIAELEQERQLAATEAMLRGQEDERRRVARDLHDGLGGMLSTVKLYLGTVRGQLVLPQESARLFARSLDHLDQSIGEMRRVARDLMPEALLHFGLVAAVQDLCETAAHTRGLDVQFQALGFADERLPQRTETVVYRLVQELLTNALRHAQARRVLVQLARHGRQVHVVVEDDGRGFDPATEPPGVGLRSVQARVDYLRGTLDVQSAPDQGTSVNIEFALEEG